MPSTYEDVPWTIATPQPPGVVQVNLKVDGEDLALWEESLKNNGREVGRFRAFSPKGNLILASALMVGNRYNIDDKIVDETFHNFLHTLLSMSIRPEIRFIKFAHTHPPTFFAYYRGRFGIGDPTQLSGGDLDKSAEFRYTFDRLWPLADAFLEVSSISLLPNLFIRSLIVPKKSSVVFLPKASPTP